MDVVTIVILIAAAWLGFYVLTVLMSQHHRQLMDAWESEQAARAKKELANGPPTAAVARDESGDAAPTTTASPRAPGRITPAADRSRP